VFLEDKMQQVEPNSSLSLTQLKHLADQLPTPFIIMGDFNGHNPLWGSKTTTDKGNKLESLNHGFPGCFGFVEVFGIVSSAIDITVSLNFKIGSVKFLIISV
jgi:hypothetical protein